MTFITSCPKPTEPTDIPPITCFEDFGQVVKFGLQYRFSSGSTLNQFTISSANPNAIASWTALLEAENSTKVQFSPLVGEPSLPPGDFREAGGGNATPFGIPKFKGRGHAIFECQLQQQDQRVAKALKMYEIAPPDLQIYFINEAGLIAGYVDDKDTPTKFRGFQLSSFRVSDKSLGGYDGIDYNLIQAHLFPNWSDNFYVVTPSDFDALTELTGS